MSLTIDVTAAAATANAYVTLASANVFLEPNIHIYATWAALSTANAEASIIFATSLLDSQIDYIGTKGASTQALRWPRDFVDDPDGYAVDSETIPVFLQKAVSFYAYYLATEDRSAESDTLGFKELIAGPLEMVIDKCDRRSVMPSIVWNIMKPYGVKIGTATRVLERR